MKTNRDAEVGVSFFLTRFKKENWDNPSLPSFGVTTS